MGGIPPNGLDVHIGERDEISKANCPNEKESETFLQCPYNDLRVC